MDELLVGLLIGSTSCAVLMKHIWDSMERYLKYTKLKGSTCKYRSLHS